MQTNQEHGPTKMRRSKIDEVVSEAQVQPNNQDSISRMENLEEPE